MPISLADFTALETPADVIIHSLDRSLYQVEILVTGDGQRLVDDAGRTLRWRSLSEARNALFGLPVATLTLHHVSAYDEMIGQPPKPHSNLLAVSLSPAYDGCPPPRRPS
jgi:hypothetical protein